MNWMTQIPHVDQYVGIWAMEETAFHVLHDWAKKFNPENLQAHLASDQVASLQEETRQAMEGEGADGAYRTTVRDGVAVIEVRGATMKHASSFSGGTSTVLLRRSIGRVMRDDSVRAAVMHFDSAPGGTAAGTYELANDVAKLAEKKPVLAHSTDLMASAAYWAGVNAESVSSNEPGKVGSIGTYAVIHDLSAMAAKEGVKVHVVRAGSIHKGAGVAGTEITPEQLAQFQKLVDETNQFFTTAVQSGRQFNDAQMSTVADGRVFIASEAKQLGLIDHVRSFDETFEAAAQQAHRKNHVRGSGPMAKTSKEIKAACPGIDSDTVLAYLEDEEKSISDCTSDWMKKVVAKNVELKESLTAKDAEIAAAKTADPPPAKTDASAVNPPAGADPVSSTGDDANTADVVDSWNDAVSAEQRKNPNLNRTDATRRARKNNRALHSQYVETVSQEHEQTVLSRRRR